MTAGQRAVMPHGVRLVRCDRAVGAAPLTGVRCPVRVAVTNGLPRGGRPRRAWVGVAAQLGRRAGSQEMSTPKAAVGRLPHKG